MTGLSPAGPGGTLEGLRDGTIRGRERRLRTATALLESSFYQELFKAMRATVPKDGMFSHGPGEDLFEGLLDQQVAEAAALRSQRGLGAALYRHLTGER